MGISANGYGDNLFFAVKKIILTPQNYLLVLVPLNKLSVGKKTYIDNYSIISIEL